MSSPCSLATSARDIHRVTFPNDLLFRCALLTTSFPSNPDFSLIMDIRTGIDPSAQSGGYFPEFSDSLITINEGVFSALPDILGSLFDGPGEFINWWRMGLQPSGGREISMPSNGITPPTESTNHPESSIFSSTDNASTGENQ